MKNKLKCHTDQDCDCLPYISNQFLGVWGLTKGDLVKDNMLIFLRILLEEEDFFDGD